ncbi:MAG: hypothetical protein F4039_05520 [Gammaproteobacteria bacterium]|nr:hypothetical protein [Gammaproteobacteria bacterium]MYF52704.1 hypothetical protein [Gammaproteobacteria bacterium]MYK43526.1 hypothetical protein [Gammaproteobacteria bacterium]
MVQPEVAILDSACRAQEFHMKMTDGWYLSYSHESFLQNFIAFELFKKSKLSVNIDPSGRKVYEEVSPWGRPPGSKRLDQRFDVVVWKKDSSSVKAVIEVKKAWRTKSVLQDVKKLRKFLPTASVRCAKGYVLYYTDKRPTSRGDKQTDIETIGGRFKRVHDSMCKHRNIGNQGIRHFASDYVFGDQNRAPWGVALYRC